MTIKEKHIKIAGILLMGICSVLFFNGYQRYQAVSPELLSNADFHDGLNQWIASDPSIEVSPNGEVKLASTNLEQFRSITQKVALPWPGALLLLSCDIKTDHVVGGKEAWKTGRVVLVSFNAAGEPLYLRPHFLAGQNGSHDWRHVKKVFEPGPDVVQVEVGADLCGSTGKLWVRNFTLHRVMLKSAFNNYRLMLLGGWLVVATWVAVPFVRTGFKSWKHAVVLALAIGIFLGVLMPENLKESMGEDIWPATATADGKVAFIPSKINDSQEFKLVPKLPKLDIFKVGHFVMFALMTITLIVINPYRASTAALLFYLCLFATVSEVLQLFMPGRSAQVGDIFIDCGGVAVGLLLSGLFMRLRRIAP